MPPHSQQEPLASLCLRFAPARSAASVPLRSMAARRAAALCFAAIVDSGQVVDVGGAFACHAFQSLASAGVDVFPEMKMQKYISRYAQYRGDVDASMTPSQPDRLTKSFESLDAMFYYRLCCIFGRRVDTDTPGHTFLPRRGCAL